MNVILGSAGFIGRALAGKLSNAEAIPTHASEFPLHRDASWVVERLSPNDTVYLCAGRTGGVGRMAADPFSFIYPNVRIAMNVIEACVKAKVKRLVCLQSTTGYPDVPWAVKEEEYLDGEPYKAYFAPGNAGRFVDRLAAIVSRETTTQIVFFRPSNVYGPRNNFDPKTSHVIEATVRKVAEKQNPFVIWGTGKEVRDAIYIDDLVDAMAMAQYPEFPPGAYNVGTGQEMSVDQMVKTLFDHADFHPTVEYDTSKPTAIPARRVDFSKLRGAGWEAKVSMEEGLKRTFDWYQSR